jgi:Putative zinc-finger
MNHDEIEADGVTSRYVAGRLTDGEEREFEAHLVDCQRCLDAVEAETSLREGLRIVGADSVPASAAAVRNPAPAGVQAHRFLQLAAGLLLAVSVGLGVWLLRSTTELDAARAERDGLQRRTRQAEQVARGLEQKLAEAPRPAAPAAATATVVPVTVFALSTVRGSSTGDGGPVNRVQIDRGTQLAVFSVEIPARTGSSDYTVALKDSAARVLWSGGAFSPSTDALSVAVDPALLKAGDYVLEVSDRRPAGGLRLVGRYPFRVSRP